MTMGYRTETKGTRTYVNKRKIISVPKKGIDSAIEEQRPPNTQELLDESRIMIGKILIGLRGADDIYRAATSIGHIVKCISSIATLEKVEELSPEVIKSMTDTELKDYVMKQLEKLN